MYQYAKISKESELETEEWTFIVMGKNIFLDTYYKKTRETKRHKFQTEKSYNRLFDRGYGSDRLKAHEVPLTDEMKTEVKKQIVDKLEVKIWTDK